MHQRDVTEGGGAGIQSRFHGAQMVSCYSSFCPWLMSFATRFTGVTKNLQVKSAYVRRQDQEEWKEHTQMWSQCVEN